MIDYQDFTTKDTPRNERLSLGIGDIFSNSATCLICGETIRSKNRHDLSICKCGNLSIDGGSWFPKRLFTKGEDSYKNTIVYYDEK